MRTSVAVTLLLVLQACGEKKGSAKLSGAMKPDIPVYEPSTVADREEASYQAGTTFDDLRSYHAYRWSLRSPDSPEKVAAFYRDLALPPEEDEEDPPVPEEFPEEGDERSSTEVFLELPSGDSESVTVTIQMKPAKEGGTRFMLRESVLADRRR